MTLRTAIHRLTTAAAAAVAAGGAGMAQTSRPAPAPASFVAAPARFDLLIVAPEAFRAVLEPYQREKAQRGVSSHAVFLCPERGPRHGVLQEFPGCDDAERLKRAIEHAFRCHGARYVLLAGDAAVVPTRWRYVQESSLGPMRAWQDGSYHATDHYYACLYTRASPQRFDDWDANENGRFDEQAYCSTENPDRVSGHPDLVVARVPARTAEELAGYLAKVSRYEAAPSKWPRRFAFAARDRDGGKRAEALRSELPERLASATERCLFDAPGLREVLPQRDPRGAGSLAGLAARAFWISYFGEGSYRGWEIPGGDKDAVARLSNGPNLPIVFALGCGTAALADSPPHSPYRDAEGHFRHYWFHAEWADRPYQVEELDAAGQHLRFIERPIRTSPPSPYDLCIPLTRGRCPAGAWLLNPNGGAICFLGESVAQAYDCGLEIERGLIAELAAGRARLGDAWLAAQRRYWNAHERDGEFVSAPRIYLSSVAMLGDPTLRLPDRAE